MIAFSGAITHTVSVVELVWFLIGVTGLVVSWANLIDCWRDTVALNFSGRNGLLRLAAQGNMREETLRVAKCVTICVIGVAAMLTPPASGARPITPLAIFLTFGLFVLGVLIVIGSIAARRTRVLMREHA